MKKDVKEKFDLHWINLGLAGISLGFGVLPPILSVGMIGFSTYALIEKHMMPDKKMREVFSTFLEKEKMPNYITTDKLNCGYLVKYKMKAGTSTKDFEKRKQEIEEYTNSKVNIEFNKGLLNIKVYTDQLKTKYPFKVEEHEKEDYIFVGYSLDGPEFISLNTFCHILFGGTTGWGKSTTLNAIITNMLLTKDFNFFLIDHKKTELSKFEKCEKVKFYSRNNEDTYKILKEIIKEMDRRNDILGRSSLSDIGEYNQKAKEKLKRNVIVIDEFAMLSKELHPLVMHILNTGRSAGFHLIICTLRPSKDVIAGDMKNNMACRISLKLITDTDSQVILDCNGAEEIKHRGRFILKSSTLKECQGMFIDSKTIKKLLKHTFVEKPYHYKKAAGETWS